MNIMNELYSDVLTPSRGEIGVETTRSTKRSVSDECEIC